MPASRLSPVATLTCSVRQALREKEKGDWKNLTKEEVQELYRATFCRTFAEIQAPTGEWKLALGGTLIACSLAIWVYIWMKLFGELRGSQVGVFQVDRVVGSISR